MNLKYYELKLNQHVSGPVKSKTDSWTHEGDKDRKFHFTSLNFISESARDVELLLFLSTLRVLLWQQKHKYKQSQRDSIMIRCDRSRSSTLELCPVSLYKCIYLCLWCHFSEKLVLLFICLFDKLILVQGLCPLCCLFAAMQPVCEQSLFRPG